MPSWGEVLAEVQRSAIARGGNPDFDGIRRGYLTALHQLTKRNTILYATRWLQGGFGGPDVTIVLEDMQGMMEVCRGMPGPELDIILHSPGGNAEAVSSIVHYLRTKYHDIRVFIPLAAMSAATMWALAANRIVMGKHSQLGPIDPQVTIPTGGPYPARAILKQFERARDECAADPSKLSAWLPTLQQCAPALLQYCGYAEELSRTLVRQWLQSYMLSGLSAADAEARAEEITNYFADTDVRLSHSLGIYREDARQLGVVVEDLEADQQLQDAVLSVFHATMHNFSAAGAVKIIENHLGRSFMKAAAFQVSVLPQPQTPPQAGPLLPTV